MVQNDLGLKVDILQGMAKKGGLGVHKGNEIVRIEICLVQELDIQLHRPDEFPVLLTGHRFRGDQGAFVDPCDLPHNFLERHSGCDSVGIGTAVHQNGQ